MVTIYIASDHAGFEIKEKIKEFLEKEGFKFVNLGHMNTIHMMAIQIMY